MACLENSGGNAFCRRIAGTRVQVLRHDRFLTQQSLVGSVLVGGAELGATLAALPDVQRFVCSHLT